MKEEWKICKNPDCRKKFYREEIHNIYQWTRMTFHNRGCQAEYYHEGRRQERGNKRRYAHKNAINFQAMHDACNRYNKGARERLKKQVTIYSSENMTQEELQALIPSMGGRR